MDWSTSTMVGRSMGIDVAWGDTSKFAIVITQYRNKKVEVFYAESFEKPQMNEIINHIMQLKQRHHCTKVYVDGANPEVIRELKARIGEYHDYYGRLTEEQIWSLRSSNSWQIIPVNFQKRHREMLQWTYTLMSKRFIKIHPSLQKLIVSLRTAPLRRRAAGPPRHAHDGGAHRGRGPRRRAGGVPEGRRACRGPHRGQRRRTRRAGRRQPTS